MSQQKKVKIGFAGLGRRGRHLLKLYASHPQCEVVAICDILPPMVELAASELKNADVGTFGSFESMVNEVDMDAVFIAASPDIQVDLACYAMNKGIHVTTEVPAAFSLKHCWDLVTTVEKTGAIYLLSEQARYIDYIRQWREMAINQDFGKILFAEGEYIHYGSLQYFQNSVTGERYITPVKPDLANVEEAWRFRKLSHPIYYLPHELSPLLSITGGRVTKVSCMGTRKGSYTFPEAPPVRDIEIAIMHTDNDTLFRLAAGFTTPHGPRRETQYHWHQVAGTLRTVEWARSNQDKPKMWTAPRPLQYKPANTEWVEMDDWALMPKDVPEYILKSGHGGLDWYPMNNFIQTILGNEKLGMDVYEAVETAAPAIMAAESSEEGGALKFVPDFRKGSPDRAAVGLK